MNMERRAKVQKIKRLLSVGNFYTLCVIYLVYSFLGWVAETVVATIKGRAFVNRGVASGPFCFVYGTAAVLMAVGFADLRSTPVALFLGCMANATVVEWVTAKLHGEEY